MAQPCFIIIIKNITNNSICDIDLFNASENYLKNDFGLPEGIDIHLGISDTNYRNLLSHLIGNKIKINEILCDSSQEQLKERINLLLRDLNGNQLQSQLPFESIEGIDSTRCDKKFSLNSLSIMTIKKLLPLTELRMYFYEELI
jgi:hypothetical protein